MKEVVPRDLYAFPFVVPDHIMSTGMTLRDWFAGQFIMGFRHSSVTHSREHMAEEAYLMADAMLAARRSGGTA